MAPLSPRRAAHVAALKAAAIYMLIAAAWVVLSEMASSALGEPWTPGGQELAKLSAFALLSTALMYAAVYRVCRSLFEERRLLQESDSRFQALFHANADPVFVYPLDADGRASCPVEVNDKACLALGYTREELLQRDILETNAGLTSEDLRERLVVLLREGRGMFESTHVRRDGTLIPVEINAHFLLLGGKPTVISVARDLTARKQAAQRLQDSERRYRLLAENAGDLIWTFDLGGRLTYLSPSAARLLGYAPEEIGDRFADLCISPETVPRLTAAFLRLIGQAGQGEAATERVELEAVRKDGTLRWLEAEMSLLRSPGGATEGVLGVGRDIQDRKLAEGRQAAIQAQLVQVQKMEALGTLAGGVAHDLNNLLVIMLGNVEIAQIKGGDATPLRRYLDNIQHAAERAADLVRKLLLFSRRQPASVHPVDVNAIINDLLRMLDRLLGERVRTQAQLEPALWVVSADASQLEQVLVNLAVNARDAMPDGGRLEIRTENASLIGDEELPDGRYVRISVRDGGVGMDPATQARIFEPFFTTKGPGQGTGLGLATVYGILKEHGGAIRVRSAPGEGSEFSLYLPATAGAAEPRAPQRPELPVPPVARSLLLVEDEPQVRDFMTQALTEYGFEVTAASTLVEARGCVEKRSFDLLISDVILPDGSGPELVQELRQREDQAQVLLISGHPGDLIAEYFPGETAPPLLRKPFTLAQLFAALQGITPS